MMGGFTPATGPTEDPDLRTSPSAEANDDIEWVLGENKPAGASVGGGATVAEALTMDGGRLTLLGKLGEGGMGAVWKARDNRLGRLVAVKRPKGALLRSRSGLERFLREARAAAQLSHPNIVTVHSVGKDAEGPFLEMEFVEGRSLREEVMNSGAGLPLERVCEIGAALCDALGLAHQQGLIHRDVKPGNILLTARGVPKLGDFGLAAARGEAGEEDKASLTATGAMLGTMYYASPEQLRDAKQVDARSDIYSLGATLYFAATGSDPRMLQLDRLPAAIRPALEQALEEAPSKRFQDMKAFEKALREAAKTGQGGTDDARCPQCRKDNPLSARHCVHCGASLAGLFKACPACNVENRVDQGFCQSCGANLRALAEAERLRADIVYAQQTRQYEEIRRLAERGLNLLPEDSFFGEWLAEANKALQRVTELEGRLSHTPADDPDEAINLLEQLLELRPDRGDCREALEKACAEKARLEEERRRIQLLRTIGEVRAQLDGTPPEDVDRRISLLARLVELAPEDRETQQALEQAQRDKTKQQIRRLRDTAKEHYLKREFQPALDALKQAQALAPDSEPLRRDMARVEEAQAAFENARAKLIAAIEGMRDRGEYEKIVDVAARSPLAAHSVVQAQVRDAKEKLARLRELTDRIPALREARGYCQLRSVLEEIEALKVHLPERDALKGECARAIESAQRCHAEALQAARTRDFPRAIVRCDEGLNACSDFVALTELRNEMHTRLQERQQHRHALSGIAVVLALVLAAGMAGYWAYRASAGPKSALSSLVEKAEIGNTYIENSAGLNLEIVWIPGGTFQTGSPESEGGREDDEGPVHRVTLDGFWLGKTEVTVGQFRRFCDAASYRTEAERAGYAYAWSGKTFEKTAGASWKSPGFTQTDAHPVVDVTWNDAAAFCAWLAKETGKAYGLPTEAQWECACRAGSTTAYPWGEEPDGGTGWCNAADQTFKETFLPDWMVFNWSDGYVFTAPVASFQPNHFELYDMIGNVWEWCADRYGPYSSASARNPMGPSSGGCRVLRGGSWCTNPASCRTAARGMPTPDNWEDFYGVRVSRRSSGP